MTKGNLLLVDDEVVLIKMLKMDLEPLADEVFIAFDGVEALEVLKKHEIHCIVCDINMPRMNGVEVLKTIRANHNDVPFIFFTGHGNMELMMEAAKYGAFDFLDKPYFEGIEDVIVRGLNTGIHKVGADAESDDELMSQYKKLLQTLK